MSSRAFPEGRGTNARQGEQLSPAARRFLDAAARQLQREYS